MIKSINCIEFQVFCYNLDTNQLGLGMKKKIVFEGLVDYYNTVGKLILKMQIDK